LNRKLFLAVGAFSLRLIGKSFHAQDITEINSVLELTVRARSVGDKLIRKHQVLGNEFGTIVNKWPGGKGDWIGTCPLEKSPCRYQYQCSIWVPFGRQTWIRLPSVASSSHQNLRHSWLEYLSGSPGLLSGTPPPFGS
jgi:hypothetical protein